MKIIKVDNKEDNISFTIEIKEDSWLKMQEKSFKKLAKNIKIPGGFRSGQPAHTLKVKSMISENDILEKTINDEITKINKFLLSQKEFLDLEEDILNSQPKFNIDKMDNKSLVISFIYKKIPTVELGDYKKIIVKVDNKINKDEIELEKNKYFKNNFELIKKENNTIEKGDFVIFDFDGFINNKKIDNASSKNFELEIGSNQFIPGFEDKMIGLKLNEEKNLELKFPKEYHAKDMADKDVLFKIKINDIKYKKISKIDDEFIKSLNIKDVNNLKEFESFIIKKIEKNKKTENYNKAKSKVFQELAKITKLSHEDNFSLEQEKKNIEDEYKKMLGQSGINLEQYIKLLGEDESKFHDNINKQALENVKVKYAIVEIIEKENIDISEKEMNDYLEKISKEEKISLEDLKNRISNNIEFIKERLIFNKAIDFLVGLSIKE